MAKGKSWIVAMAYSVFISYSTKDLHIANHIRAALSVLGVNVFIAESSVLPSMPLTPFIEAAIRQCDLFALLWTRNAKVSDYVPQEIGIAKGCNKTILPVVLEPGLRVPGFISDLKYLDASGNPAQSVAWLQQFVAQNAAQKAQSTALLVLLALLATVVLMTIGGE
jgi:hypothetical protein